jgi:hypothetical protein
MPGVDDDFDNAVQSLTCAPQSGRDLPKHIEGGIGGMLGAIALASQEEDHRVVGTDRGVRRRLLAADAGGRNTGVKRQRY